MAMAGALGVTHVRPYVHHVNNVCSQSLGILISFMKLGHIVMYQNVFLKFDNGQYCHVLFPFVHEIISQWPIFANIRFLSL